MSSECQDAYLLKVKSEIKQLSRSKDIENTLTIMQQTLENLLQKASLEKGEKATAHTIDKELPIIHYHLEEKNNQSLSLSLLCHAQQKISLNNFLFDLVRFHLIPGNNLYPSSFHHLTFRPTKAYGASLYLAHLFVLIPSERDFNIIQSNLPFIIQVLERGIHNPQYAKSILNRQLPIHDEKSNQIHEHLLQVINKGPSYEDFFLNEASVFLALSPEIFKQHRSSKHLTRIICSLAWMRQNLRETSGLSARRPQIYFRLFPITLQFTFGEKQTMGLCIGISHLNDYQLFNERCILQAVCSHFPEIQTVKSSHISYQHPQDKTHALYIELEKKKGEKFTLQEIKHLKHHLSQSLGASIEDVAPSIFMMSNEEEIMKNIRILRDELDSIDDLPQVIISFECQTLSHITFIITLVRIVEQNKKGIHEQFSKLNEEWEFIPERKRIVGKEGDEITKEAHVFRLRLKKSAAFVRTDSSVNLHQARQHVVDFLYQQLGPIRDFTGSIIILQNTLFSQFKEKYKKTAQKYPNLLDDFFYTLSPADVQITLPFLAIETLFEHFMELIEATPTATKNYAIKKSENTDFAFTALRMPSNSSEVLDQKIRTQALSQTSLITTKIQFQEHTLLGYICWSDNAHERAAFFQQLQVIVLSHIKKEQGIQTLHLNISVYPTSLDPRITLFPTTNYIFKLLFDGLMRIDANGNPCCAVAESYTLSPDHAIYTFKLRESYWNNGDPVTAHDFAHAWKKVLSPTFDTPFAYLFYPIKNAKAAKKGEISLDKVGIQAKDDLTLVVYLEYPVPHFLRYLTLNLFFPVNQRIDSLHPDWPFRTSEEYVCNGPFILEKVSTGKELQLVKNPLYWDNQRVHLSRVNISRSRIDTMFKRFQNGEIDWLGAPLSRWKKQFLQCERKKETLAQSQLNWIVVNTQCFPFNNKKLRQALWHALNLEELVEQLPIDAHPTRSPLPPIYSNSEPIDFRENREKARILFKEALYEMGISGKELPKLTILHSQELSIRKNLFLKMSEQLKASLDIDLNTEVISWDKAYRKNQHGNFQLFILGWKYLCHTPFYFLDTFESIEQHQLYPWSCKRYCEALHRARQEENLEKQKEKVAELEKILIEEVPVIPLYYENEYYIKNNRLKGVIIDDQIGSIDFKTAYFKSLQPEKNQLIQWI